MAQYGIYTDRQRKYLNGDLDDLDPADERALRAKIRDRTDTAFAEFPLLTKIDEQDRKQIFAEKLIRTDDDPHVLGGMADAGTMKRDADPWEAGGPLQMQIGFGHLLQFVYTGLREQATDRDRFVAMLESELERAITDAERELDPSDAAEWHVSASIDVERVADVNLDAARGKLERGEDLFPIEAKALLDAGELVPNDD